MHNSLAQVMSPLFDIEKKSEKRKRKKKKKHGVKKGKKNTGTSISFLRNNISF